MPRVPVFDVPHKALRNALGRLSYQAGRTDFTNPKQVDDLVIAGNTVFQLLKDHAAGEDIIYQTDLMTFDSWQAKRMETEHHRIEANQAKVEKALNEIASKMKKGEDVTGLGYVFVAKYNGFHTNYLNHILDEETVIQPLIWKNMTDEQIIEQSKKIVAKIPPQSMGIWFKFILPALNPMEHVILFKGMKANLPPQAYEGILNQAKSILLPNEFELVQKSL